MSKQNSKPSNLHPGDLDEFRQDLAKDGWRVAPRNPKNEYEVLRAEYPVGGGMVVLGIIYRSERGMTTVGEALQEAERRWLRSESTAPAHAVGPWPATPAPADPVTPLVNGTCPRLVGTPARLYVVTPKQGGWATICSSPVDAAYYRGKPDMRIREFVEVEAVPRLTWVDWALAAAGVLAVIAMLWVALWSLQAHAAEPSVSCATDPQAVATVQLPDGSVITASGVAYLPGERRVVISGTACVFSDGFGS
jgi:hypothetical protein